MNFKEFERLEKFNLLTKEIENKHSSFKGSETPTKSKKGLVIKSDGYHERN